MHKPRRFLSLIIILLLLFAFYRYGRSIWYPWYLHFIGKQTVESVIRRVGPDVEKRLKPYFEKASVSFPPKKLTLIALKKEKKVELWVDKGDRWCFIRNYDITAASGKLGPKRREGDRQVPEGIYNIIALNPNGDFYLTMLLDYPNELDKENAKSDNRTGLGGDICIHGKAASIGCIAVGDIAAEEIFYLVVKAGMRNARIIISPNDLRVGKPIDNGQFKIPWVRELYDAIELKLKDYPSKQEN